MSSWGLGFGPFMRFFGEIYPRIMGVEPFCSWDLFGMTQWWVKDLKTEDGEYYMRGGILLALF